MTESPSQSPSQSPVQSPAKSPADAMTGEEREEKLQDLFSTFCSFGTSRGSTSNLTSTRGSSNNLNQEPTIDSARWVKFFRDLNLQSKVLNTTELDIIFNKAKVWAKRPDRRLDYHAFVYALQLAALSKYKVKAGDAPAEAAAYQQLLTEICSANVSGPAMNTSIEAAVTNSSLSRPSSARGSTGNLGAADYSPTVPEIPKGSVFDRLTNHKGYTGTHKERFDKDGKGRGAAGRRQEDVGTLKFDKIVHRT